MKNLSLILATVLFFAIATVSTAQDTNEAEHDVTISIPTVAIVDIEDASGDEATTISFTYSAADLVNEAGSKLNFASKTNTDLYLQYTSIVSSTSNASNSISAKLASGSTIPSGMSLKVKASASAITGKVGTTGTGGTEQTLTTSGSGVSIVTGIKSCYTGNGASGHLLTYKLDIADTDAAYNSLTSDDYSATVVYTITEN